MRKGQVKETLKIKKIDHLDQTLLYISRLGMTYAEYQKMQTFEWLQAQEARRKRRSKKHGHV